MDNLHFTYPAFYETDGEMIKIEIPDLGIGPFYISEKERKSIADIAWDKAARAVQLMIYSGITPPPSRRLEDLEISEDETRDAFLIELIS